MTVHSGDDSGGLAREIRGEVLWLMFDRPRASNAVDGTLAQAFSAALMQAVTDPAVAAVVISGVGSRVFSAGIDVKNPGQLDHESLSAYRRGAVSACLSAIVDFEKPLVAAVNGPAIGLGCMLALLTDQVLAVEKAAFSLPEIEIGIPTFLGISILARAAGHALARDLVLSGRRMVAAEAMQRGLVSQVVSTEELTSAAQTAAETLSAKPAMTFALNKRWLARGLREELAAANAHSKAIQPQLAAENHAAGKH